MVDFSELKLELILVLVELKQLPLLRLCQLGLVPYHIVAAYGLDEHFHPNVSSFQLSCSYTQLSSFGCHQLRIETISSLPNSV